MKTRGLEDSVRIYIGRCIGIYIRLIGYIIYRLTATLLQQY